MRIDDEGRFLGRAGCGDAAALREDFLLTALDNLVRTRVLDIGMCHDIVLAEVIFQIRVRQRVRVERREALDHLERDLPRRIDVLDTGVALDVLEVVAVLPDVVADLRHEILARLLVLDARPPTEVVEAEVFPLDVMQRLAARDLRHLALDVDRHVADVEDAGVRAEAARCLCNDGRRVRVVEHPGVRRIFLHIVDDLDDAADGAHAVGDAARAAGLLAEHAVLQRNLLILRAHLVLADADMREHEVDVRERRLRIRRREELTLADDDLASVRDNLLALGVVVIELDLAQRETILVREEHHDNARRERAAAARDDDGEFLVLHVIAS